MQNHLFCQTGQHTKVLRMSVPSTPEKLVQASNEWLAMEPWGKHSFSICKSIKVWCCVLETLAKTTAGTSPVDYWLHSLLKGHTELEGLIGLQTLFVALIRVEDIQNLDRCPSEYHIPWNLLLIILAPQKRDDNSEALFFPYQYIQMHNLRSLFFASVVYFS